MTLLEMVAARRETLQASGQLDAQRAEKSKTVEETKAACKSLYGFIREAWKVLEPSTEFVDGWAVEAICDHLEAVTDGRIKRLLINVPPGFAKSLIVSVFWPAWEWGPRALPSMRYLTSSYELGLAMRDNNRMRRLIKSDWYQEHWGNLVQITADQDAKQKFENSATGGRECRAFNSLTGGRGDRVIIDDPHSTVTAESDQVRAEAITVFTESVPSRVNDPKTSAIVVIMQRLHESDVSGVILSRKLGYEHLMLPMEFEMERRCRTSIGFLDPRTVEGELLHPERVGRAEVDALKKSLRAYGIAGQLQQRPSPREGALFKVGMIEVVDAIPAGITKIVRAWDFAATRPTPGRDPDYTAGLKLLRDATGFLYIVGVVRFRDTADVVETTVKNTAKVDGSNCRVRIPQDPGQAGKGQAAAYGRALAGYPINIVPPTGDKVTRAGPAAAQVGLGNVKMLRQLEGETWNDDFIAELTTFPAGSHDDQVDAFSDAVSEICDVATNEGLFEYFRQEAENLLRAANGEKKDVASGNWIVLAPPPTISSAYGRDGTEYVKDSQGHMTVHPEDAPAFLSQMGWLRIGEAGGLTDMGEVPAYLKSYVDYVRNTAQVPLRTEDFDDDWEPAGPRVRDEMKAAGLITVSTDGIRLVGG